LCGGERVDEAVLAAFTDFLGRTRSAEAGIDADELLRRSTRAAAVARMQAADEQGDACRGARELIAARISGELRHDDEPLRKHLRGCPACRSAAGLIARAEDALARTPEGPPSGELRARWLELAAREGPEAEAAPEPEAEPRPEAEIAPVPEPEPELPPTPETVRVRARRGGLVGAARRLAASTRRR
jgi:hypothetical protein